MYPFERFAVSAKRVLSLAQEEAELLDAAGEQNYERAAGAQKRADSLNAKLQRAEMAWLNEPGG